MHQVQHTDTGGTDAVQNAPSCPYLAMLLASEGEVSRSARMATREYIHHLEFRATFPRWLRIDRRTRKFEHLADPLQTRRLARRLGGLTAYRDDFPREVATGSSRNGRKTSSAGLRNQIRKCRHVLFTNRKYILLTFINRNNIVCSSLSGR